MLSKKYFRNVRWFIHILMFASLHSYGGVSSCVDRGSGRMNERISAESKSNRLQVFDYSTLNLKTNNHPTVARTAAAVSITLADFNNITTSGNTWLWYQNTTSSFSMNIGTANNTSPQIWSLPANFLSYFDGAGRSDFISPSSLPAALQISGADKVTRTLYFDTDNRPMQKYDHYFYDTSSGTTLNHLGTSYDLEIDSDKTFDEPDYQLSPIPLALGTNYNSTVEDEDYVSGLTLKKLVVTTNVDAYGTIATPNGTANCLRMSITKQTFTRPNETTAYTLVSTENFIGFATPQGELFGGKVSSTSGTATVTDFTYRRVVPTALLSETTDVRLNNDSKGVTINNDNAIAHPSAILDIKDDSLGVLIPRIAKANRPKSPATGLLVYQVDNTSGFYYFDGTAWQRLAQTAPSPGRIAVPNTEIKQGSQALEKGVAFIKFDQPRDDFENLVIQLQLEGDCNGLYISKKTREGFEVRELQKGKSNVKFSWQIN